VVFWLVRCHDTREEGLLFYGTRRKKARSKVSGLSATEQGNVEIVPTASDPEGEKKVALNFTSLERAEELLCFEPAEI